MSSQQLRKIEHSAVIVASDLKTGRPVYRTPAGDWSARCEDGFRFTVLASAQEVLVECSLETTTVIDAYLINIDEHGRPQHIREAIRSAGPSIVTDAISVAA